MMKHRAFTIIELLVTLGIIGILIGLAIPALSGARQRAQDAAWLSNLRQSGVMMETYTQSYRAWLPYAPEGSSFPLSPGGSGITIQPGYWDLSAYWSSLFMDIAPWEEWFQVWTAPDPRRPRDRPWAIDPRSDSPFLNGVTSLRYARSLFARPEIWQQGQPITDRDSVLRGVRINEVRFPSAKVSLFDRELCVRAQCDDPMGIKRGMVFLDGHAAMLALSDANPPRKPRLPELAVYGALPVHDTKGGVAGRDYGN